MSITPIAWTRRYDPYRPGTGFAVSLVWFGLVDIGLLWLYVARFTYTNS
jgi:hypothetical protein